jgi:hypothetical protein
VKAASAPGRVRTRVNVVRADRRVHTEPERRVTGEGQLLAVAAAAAWLGVGFVMVVAVAC